MKRKVGEFVIRERECALVFTAGPKTYDIIHRSGFVERLKQAWADDQTRLADDQDFHGDKERTTSILRAEADKAREERRTGARIKRGALWPSH